MVTKSKRRQQAAEQPETANAETETMTAPDVANVPDPVLPRRGTASKFRGMTLIANPKLGGVNPRRDDTNGFRFHQYILDAGADGISYDELRNKCAADEAIKGFDNHLRWDLDHSFVLIKERLSDEAVSEVKELFKQLKRKSA